MEDVRAIGVWGLVIGLLFIPAVSSAYTVSTHEVLTRETIQLFERFHGDIFDDAEENLIVRGSAEEDSPLYRTLYHFYDPVHNRGIKGNTTSKDWAQNTKLQARFDVRYLAMAGSLTRSKFGSGSDYSWNRAVYEYVHRDKERALEALGHILHLIQDVSVPAHTRNDAHPPYFDDVFGQKSPYEGWAHKVNLEDLINFKGLDVVRKNTLNEYFDSLAEFSNQNFFSADSIFITMYSVPKIDYTRTEILSDGLNHTFGYNSTNKGDFRIVEIRKFIDLETFEPIVEYVIKDKDHLIVNENLMVLSKEAVEHGAGVIELFFDAVEEEKQTAALYYDGLSLAERIRTSSSGSIFNVAKTLYGSSVDYEDVQDDTASLPSDGEWQENQVSIPQNTDGEQNDEIEQDEQREPTQERSADELSGDEQSTDDTAHEESATTENEESSEREDNTFTIANPPIPGGSVANPVIEDEETHGTTTATTTTDHATNTLAAPTLSVGTCNNSIGVSECVVATTTLAFSWNSTEEDVNYFAVDTNGSFSTTTATSSTYVTKDNSSYAFSVSAVSAEGITSATTTKSVYVSQTPVIFNEIAWTGTATSSADEWVELYNPTEKDISLEGWVMLAEDGAPYVELSGTIEAGDYYLIERTDDTTVSNISADLVAPFSGEGDGAGLENTGEDLKLVRAFGGSTTTMDHIPNSSGWFAGSSTNFLTMERSSTTGATSSAGTWANALGEFIRNGEDANGDVINGTANVRNSVAYLINGNGVVNTDTTLTEAKSPYLVGRNGLTVAAGATLTVEPGVVIKMVVPNTPAVKVDGTLTAEGSAEKPIVFTAFPDDTYGGDMNNDGICDPGNTSSTAACPDPGMWKHIVFSETADASTLSYVTVRYGGRWFGINSHRANIVVDEADIDISNITSEYSYQHGIQFIDSEAQITESTIQKNNHQATAVGIEILDGSPKVQSNTLSENTTGIRVTSSAATIQSNTIEDSDGDAIIVSASVDDSFSGNTGSGNARNGIIIGAQTIYDGKTHTFTANNIPYILEGVLRVTATSTLALSDGVVFKSTSRGRLRVDSEGSITHSGTQPDGVVFTSVHDDSIVAAVDTATTSPAAGDWDGLVARSGGVIDLSGITLRYAGDGNGIDLAGIRVHPGAATTTLAHVVLEHNNQSGIYIEDSVLEASNTTIRNHTEGVGDAAGIYLDSSKAVLAGITFSGNDKDIIGVGNASAVCGSCSAATTSPEDLL